MMTWPCSLHPTPEREVELARLGDDIAELAAHLDAATARLLDLTRELDARGGWGNGFRSCAEWLTWRIGLAPGAAREPVRVARALGTLPRLAQALARGELSYSKVRAITRVATPETEERLLSVGRGGTAQHVERIVRAWRAVDRTAEVRETAKRHRARALHVYQKKTVWSSSAGGWSQRRAPCSCRRSRLLARRSIRRGDAATPPTFPRERLVLPMVPRECGLDSSSPKTCRLRANNTRTPSPSSRRPRSITV